MSPLFLQYRPPRVPEAAELVEERQRIERVHAVEEQHAVEMIGLVLDHARGEAAGAHVDAPSGAVVGLHLNLACARYFSPDVRDAEAALPILVSRVPDRRDLGVDQDHERHALLVAILLVLVWLEA